MTPEVVITDAKLVDGRGIVANRANVRIRNGIIAETGDGPVPRSARVIDASGRTVCPGLMNAHVHMSLDGTADPEDTYTTESEAETTLGALPRLKETLLRGVTTARDLGGKHGVTFALANHLSRGAIVGPQLLAAGQVITSPGGHGHWMGIEVEGSTQARAAAESLARAGAQVVKLMATAGMMTSGQAAGAPQLTVEEMQICVREARLAGIPVAAHAEGWEGAANAIEAGVDSIEHGHGLEEDLLLRMIEKKIALVPTISCDRVIVEQGVERGVPESIVEDCSRLAPSLEVAVEKAIEMGVTICAGNDGGAPITHAGDIVDELEVYVEKGMNPQAALQSATTNTAQLFGLHQVGLIEAGQRGDLLILQENPLASISHLRRPDAVITSGRVFTSGEARLN